MQSSIDYATYLRSPHWLALSTQARAYYGECCAVCGLDYRDKGKRLHVHHYGYYRNGESILGKERIGEDLCLLCEDHHPKGAFSKDKVRMWRKSYRWRKRMVWLFQLLMRFLYQVLRLTWKSIIWMMRAPTKKA